MNARRPSTPAASVGSFLQFFNQLQHVVKGCSTASVNWRSVAQPRHAEIRLIVQRFTSCHAETYAEFSGQGNQNSMTQRTGRKRVVIAFGKLRFDSVEIGVPI